MADNTAQSATCTLFYTECFFKNTKCMKCNSNSVFIKLTCEVDLKTLNCRSTIRRPVGNDCWQVLYTQNHTTQWYVFLYTLPHCRMMAKLVGCQFVIKRSAVQLLARHPCTTLGKLFTPLCPYVGLAESNGSLPEGLWLIHLQADCLVLGPALDPSSGLPLLLSSPN